MDSNILYCHLFIDKTKGIFQTFKINLPNFKHMHILEMKTAVEEEIENMRKMENISTEYSIQYLSKTIHSKSISDSIKLDAFFFNKDDIFCCVSNYYLFTLRTKLKASYKSHCQ